MSRLLRWKWALAVPVAAAVLALSASDAQAGERCFVGGGVTAGHRGMSPWAPSSLYGRGPSCVYVPPVEFRPPVTHCPPVHHHRPVVQHWPTYTGWHRPFFAPRLPALSGGLTIIIVIGG